MKCVSKMVCRQFALAIAVALMALVSSASAAMEQGKAVVRAVRGTAEYSTGGAWAALKVGQVLHGGASIRTASNSEVDLFLGANGPSVRVTESTTLGVDKLTFDNTGAETVVDTQLDLKTGRILGNVNKTSSASRFEIKTPTGVAGIRGTKFDINHKGVVKVKNGSVVVVYVDAAGKVSTFVVNGGMKFDPKLIDPNNPGKSPVVPLTDAEKKSGDWDKIGGNQPVTVTVDASKGRPGEPVVVISPTTGERGGSSGSSGSGSGSGSGSP